MRCLSTALTTVLATALSTAATPAMAWGKTGHAAIADIAELSLQPAVLAEVKRLIAIDGATHMADVASWADEAGQRVLGSPVHTTRIPVNGTPAPTHACPDGGLCADEAIAYYSPILADRQQADAAREAALKYIIPRYQDRAKSLTSKDAPPSDPAINTRYRRAGLRKSNGGFQQKLSVTSTTPNVLS